MVLDLLDDKNIVMSRIIVSINPVWTTAKATNTEIGYLEFNNNMN